MAKIVFIGAGSLGFTRGLVRDCLTFPSMRDAQFALVDIHPGRLELSRQACQKIVDAGSYPATVTATTDRTRALEGADAVMTQLFFNNRHYFDFVTRARKIGIQVPIVPGIMPVTHGPQIEKFSRMCGAEIPSEIHEAIVRFGDDQASIMKFGIEYATRQCEELLQGGAPGLHFYTLNQSLATRQIYANLHLARTV